jgi:integrase
VLNSASRSEFKTGSRCCKEARGCRASYVSALGCQNRAHLLFSQRCISSLNLLTLIQRYQQSGQERACHAELVNQATSRRVVNGGLFGGGWTRLVRRSGFTSGREFAPFAGPGVLSRSARERRAREIIAESGADTEEYFNKVVKQEGSSVTFRKQAASWLEQVRTRKRKPVAVSTLELWEGCLRNWLNPLIGDLPLSEINNGALKRLVAAMSEGGLKPKTIDNYAQVVKMVVASAVDKEGEEIYPRKWNSEFVDMPVVEKSKQNTPCFSSEVMSGLADWKKERERMVFILSGAAGLRIGEALGLEIDKHISPDFLTVGVEQKARHGKVEGRLKTASSHRKIDLHPAIATMLKEFVGERKKGFLFCTRNGKPLGSSNILRRHLHPALKQLGFVNPFTGTNKAGNHAFRRFRNTHLRNRTGCPEGLLKFWMGHADESMSALYDKIKEDEKFRREWAEKCGFGFELPSVVPNVTAKGEK